MITDGEWLETDGLGGFAMGTARGIPTRRYHALSITAFNPPSNRIALVNAVEVFIEVSGVKAPLSSFRFAPSIVAPDNSETLKDFSPTPWPTWRFEHPKGGAVVAELLMAQGMPLTFMRWSSERATPISLVVRPLLSCRDYHALQRENPACSMKSRKVKDKIYWRPYDNCPEIVGISNGEFTSAPQWHYKFQYQADEARGFESIEDLWSPGYYSFELNKRAAVLIFGGAHRGENTLPANEPPLESFNRVADHESKRRRSLAPLHKAAEDFLVQRGQGLTILAGYPWFLDWGRDTFIAMRGIAIARGKLSEATSILSQWSKVLSRGMMPNRFLDGGGEPEYNSIDASLWFIIAAYELVSKSKSLAVNLDKAASEEILTAIELILQSYSQGTRYQIRTDSDGLVRGGESGTQLTWMDAKIGNYVVTPRIGKPVEVQALWINALKIGRLLLPQSSDRWLSLHNKATASFTSKFWNSERSALHDVVDVDHKIGAVDSRIRPNQIFAVGGLPFPVIDSARGKQVIDTVHKALLTPKGLRTLEPGERGYAPTYEGDTGRRDFAYHQGTVWPWLLGAFIEGWVRVRGETPQAKREAKERFITPILESLDPASGGHIPEIADADPPHAWRGAPAQAWSIGEILRISGYLAER